MQKLEKPNFRWRRGLKSIYDRRKDIECVSFRVTSKFWVSTANIYPFKRIFLKRKTWQRRDKERQDLYHVKETPLIKTGHWFDNYWGRYEYEWRNLGAQYQFNLSFDSIKSLGLKPLSSNRKL